MSHSSGPGDPFGDIPFFRELQRLLTSSEGGPINYEIAGQIARAIATEGRHETGPDRSIAASFAEVTHSAEQMISGATGLSPEEPALSAAITRSEWVEGAIKGWRWLLEPLGRRFTSQMTGMGGEGSGAEIQAAMGQMAPLLLGMQAGTLIGHLSKESLGRFDLPVPFEDDGRLFIVVPNADEVAREYSFDPPTFYRWLGINEAARGVLTGSVPWLIRYLRGLLTEVVESIEIDISDIERRLTELQSGGMEALQEGFGPQGTLPVVPTERHRKALDRTDALLAVFEGYARRSVREVSESVIGDTTSIDEAMTRRNLSPSDGETMLAGVLGLSLDRSLESAGEIFCNAIIKLEGINSLNRVWAAPDNLPTLAEIKDPFAWMERLEG